MESDDDAARQLIASYRSGRTWAYISDRARREGGFDEVFTEDEQDLLIRVLRDDEAGSTTVRYDETTVALLHRALTRTNKSFMHMRRIAPKFPAGGLVFASAGYDSEGIVLSRIEVGATGLRATVGIWVDSAERPVWSGAHWPGDDLDATGSHWLRDLGTFRRNALYEWDLVTLRDDVGSAYAGPSGSHGPMSVVEMTVGGAEVWRSASEWQWLWFPGPPPGARSLTFAVGRRDVGRDAVAFDVGVPLPDDWADIAQPVPMMVVRERGTGSSSRG